LEFLGDGATSPLCVEHIIIHHFAYMCVFVIFWGPCTPKNPAYWWEGREKKKKENVLEKRAK